MLPHGWRRHAPHVVHQTTHGLPMFVADQMSASPKYYFSDNWHEAPVLLDDLVFAAWMSSNGTWSPVTLTLTPGRNWVAWQSAITRGKGRSVNSNTAIKITAGLHRRNGHPDWKLPCLYGGRRTEWAPHAGWLTAQLFKKKFVCRWLLSDHRTCLRLRLS